MEEKKKEETKLTKKKGDEPEGGGILASIGDGAFKLARRASLWADRVFGVGPRPGKSPSERARRQSVSGPSAGGGRKPSVILTKKQEEEINVLFREAKKRALENIPPIAPEQEKVDAPPPQSPSPPPSPPADTHPSSLPPTDTAPLVSQPSAEVSFSQVSKQTNPTPPPPKEGEIAPLTPPPPSPSSPVKPEGEGVAGLIAYFGQLQKKEKQELPPVPRGKPAQHKFGHVDEQENAKLKIIDDLKGFKERADSIAYSGWDADEEETAESKRQKLDALKIDMLNTYFQLGEMDGKEKKGQGLIPRQTVKIASVTIEIEGKLQEQATGEVLKAFNAAKTAVETAEEEIRKEEEKQQKQQRQQQEQQWQQEQEEQPLTEEEEEKKQEPQQEHQPSQKEPQQQEQKELLQQSLLPSIEEGNEGVEAEEIYFFYQKFILIRNYIQRVGTVHETLVELNKLEKEMLEKYFETKDEELILKPNVSIEEKIKAIIKEELLDDFNRLKKELVTLQQEQRKAEANTPPPATQEEGYGGDSGLPSEEKKKEMRDEEDERKKYVAIVKTFLNSLQKDVKKIRKVGEDKEDITSKNVDGKIIELDALKIEFTEDKGEGDITIPAFFEEKDKTLIIKPTFEEEGAVAKVKVSDGKEVEIKISELTDPTLQELLQAFKATKSALSVQQKINELEQRAKEIDIDAKKIGTLSEEEKKKLKERIETLRQECVSTGLFQEVGKAKEIGQNLEPTGSIKVDGKSCQLTEEQKKQTDEILRLLVELSQKFGQQQKEDEKKQVQTGTKVALAGAGVIPDAKKPDDEGDGGGSSGDGLPPATDTTVTNPDTGESPVSEEKKEEEQEEQEEQDPSLSAVDATEKGKPKSIDMESILVALIQATKDPKIEAIKGSPLDTEVITAEAKNGKDVDYQVKFTTQTIDLQTPEGGIMTLTATIANTKNAQGVVNTNEGTMFLFEKTDGKKSNEAKILSSIQANIESLNDNKGLSSTPYKNNFVYASQFNNADKGNPSIVRQFVAIEFSSDNNQSRTFNCDMGKGPDGNRMFLKVEFGSNGVIKPLEVFTVDSKKQHQQINDGDFVKQALGNRKITAMCTAAGGYKEIKVFDGSHIPKIFADSSPPIPAMHQQGIGI